MQAIVQDRYGPFEEVLRLEEVDRPQVADDEVLIRVRAASVHPDVWQVVTGHPAVLRLMGAGIRRPKQRIPGTDVAGIIESVGARVTRFEVGDAVFGEIVDGHQWHNGGAFAEYVAAPVTKLASKPAQVSFEQAATVPSSGLIALQGVCEQGHVEAGQRVLVNGAGGGVGSFAVQIAKAHGAHVTAVDRTDKLETLRSIGADEVIDFTQQDYTTRGERYDLIVDIPGNRSLKELKRALEPDGLYVLIGHELYGSSRGLSAPDDPTSPAAVQVPPYYPDTPAVREDLARHYDNIREMDREVGDVLAQLEADGLAESTIVIWTTDHGDGLPRAKRELFDSGIRVPMVIRWPEAYRPDGVRPGTLDERLISFVDLGPTLLRLAGVEVPAHMHGRALAALGGEERRYVFAASDRVDAHTDRQRAVRDARFKLIRHHHPELPGAHRSAFRDNQESVRELWRLYEAGELDATQRLWFEPPGEARLYDLDADPHEVVNLAGDPRHAEALTRLRDALDAWGERVEDWSDVPEAEMVARLWPAGEQPVTPAPEISRRDGLVHLRDSEPGASLGYRVGDGAWQLYTVPFAAPAGVPVSGKAVRYGWAESDESVLRAD